MRRTSEAGLLGRAAVIAALVPLLVRLDLRRLQEWLEPRAPARGAGPGGAVTSEKVEAVGRQVERVIRRGHPLVRPGCLTRGITRYYLLRRAGLDATLCFGVAAGREAGGIGHCWVTLEGAPVLEVGDPRSTYFEVARLSAQGVRPAETFDEH